MSDAEDKPADETPAAEAPAPRDPVRRWTLIILGACAVLMVYYLIADRVTPYTTQARVHAFVVPVAAEVAGTVTEVPVRSNQVVTAGELLFQVDRERYALAVETAEVNLQTARQATGASTANVDAAAAQVASARAALVRSEQDAVRLRRIKDEDPGAISDRRIEQAEASLAVSRSQLAAAEAGLERARQDLGSIGLASWCHAPGIRAGPVR